MMAIDKKQVRVRDSCERLAARGCAREVRARVAMRVLTVALVAFAATFFFPNYAFAASGVLWGPGDLPGGDRGVVVGADNDFDAAAMALGYSYSDIQSWSPEIKAKLSNASTGGNFYVFVQKFSEFDGGANLPVVLQALYDAVGSAFFAIAETLYGNDIWLAVYTQELGLNAAYDLKLILQGGNIGGGSSGSSGYYEFDFKPVLPLYSGVTKVCVAKSMYVFRNNTAGFEDEIKSGCVILDDVGNPARTSLTLWLSSEPDPSYTLRDDKYYSSMSFDVTKGKTVDVSSSKQCALRQDGTTLYVEPAYYQVIWEVENFITSSRTRSLYYSDTYGAGIFTASTSTPVVPPTNWPDEPEAPSPPELPEPSDPTVDPPEPYDPYDPVVDPPAPYNPTGGDTYIYNITNVTEPTDTSSVLEWVKKIFYELKALHSDLSTWVQNLGSSLDKLRVTLNNGFTQLYGAIDDVESDIQDVVSAVDNANRQIYNRIGDFWTNLKSEFVSLKQYLRQLFNWLGEKMNFTAEGYDDTSVIYWLKRIWSKLGDGDINVRPTDPTVDPPAWWDWLNRMLDSLLDGLVGVFNNLLGGTGDLLEEVIHQFPFSIPWDIAAFLTVLSAQPVTPVFDIVIPAIDNWWPEYTIHVDMAPFDTAAATIRLMTKVVFAGCLAWKSRELLDMMDVTKW